jgi:hypothetical protein
MMPFFFDNYMLRFGETFSTMFMEEFVQAAWRVYEHNMLQMDENALLTNPYDILSIAKYDKLSQKHDLNTGYYRILYTWTLRLKHGFDLVYEIEELNDANYAQHEKTKIEITVSLEKDGYKIRNKVDTDRRLTAWDVLTLREYSRDLEEICGASLRNLHKKMDAFNARQQKQDPVDNQAFFERLMRTEEFRELYPLTEQMMVEDGKMYVYPEIAPSQSETGAYSASLLHG